MRRVGLLLLVPLVAVIEALVVVEGASTYLMSSSINVLRSADTYRYLNITINDKHQTLLFDSNSPILFYHSTSVDSAANKFALNYSSTIKGPFLDSYNISIAPDIFLSSQYAGQTTSLITPPLRGIFGHSYFNPILLNLNSSHSEIRLANETLDTNYTNLFTVVVFDTSDSISVNNESQDMSVIPGLVVYGALDQQALVKNNIFFTAALASQSYHWLVGISAVTVDGQQLFFNNTLKLDNGASISNASRATLFHFSESEYQGTGEELLLATSYEDAVTIHSALSEVEFDNRQFLLNCSETKVLQLNIGGNFWNVTPADYVGPSADSSGKCYSRIKTYTDASGKLIRRLYMFDYEKVTSQKFWVLGLSFFRSLNVVFDVDTRLVGLSRRKNANYNIYTDDSFLDNEIRTNSSLLQEIQSLGANSSLSFELTTISSVLTTSVSLSYSNVTTVFELRIIFGPFSSDSTSSTSKSHGSSSFEIFAGEGPWGNWKIYVILGLVSGVLIM